ncbi:hypothetical protein [Microbulbifer epialgicus]|uniref:Uncharacterized protein n=1 Tax=Microbulbifer epialgicus TaxID=393907 RepID=A0ABV4P696_9GAMM
MMDTDSIIFAREPCPGDEVMTYEFLVKPSLKTSVLDILKESTNELALARALCRNGILEAGDSYV